jgi:hypothetical protein
MEDCSKTIGGKRVGEEHKMENIGAEQCLVVNVSSPTDPKVGSCRITQHFHSRIARAKWYCQYCTEVHVVLRFSSVVVHMIT